MYTVWKFQKFYFLSLSAKNSVKSTILLKSKRQFHEISLDESKFLKFIHCVVLTLVRGWNEMDNQFQFLPSLFHRLGLQPHRIWYTWKIFLDKWRIISKFLSCTYLSSSWFNDFIRYCCWASTFSMSFCIWDCFKHFLDLSHFVDFITSNRSSILNIWRK